MDRPPPANLRVAVVQDGARRHYATPLALQRAGALNLMFSELFFRRELAAPLAMMARLWGGAGMRRCWDGVAMKFPPEGANQLYPGPAATTGAAEIFSEEAFYRWSASMAGRWIARRGLEDSNVLFGFIRNLDPDLCRRAHEAGLATVGDQMIAPAAVEAEEMRIQLQRWPEWEAGWRGQKPDYAIVQEVETRTWPWLDRIACASNYVRSGLLQQGIAAEKIEVIPNPVEAERYAVPDRRGRKKITVGFVGAVGLRKGAPYFFSVAEWLKSAAIEFVAVGPVRVSEAAIKAHGGGVTLPGRAARSEIQAWLAKFDLLLFPSTCEGSAGAVREAMACGLPVVTSENSGSLVRDGAEGFIRPYDDIDGMAACVQRLATDEGLRLAMGQTGRRTVESTNLQSYSRQLLKVMAGAMERREISTGR